MIKFQRFSHEEQEVKMKGGEQWTGPSGRLGSSSEVFVMQQPEHTDTHLDFQSNLVHTTKHHTWELL